PGGVPERVHGEPGAAQRRQGHGRLGTAHVRRGRASADQARSHRRLRHRLCDVHRLLRDPRAAGRRTDALHRHGDQRRHLPLFRLPPRCRVLGDPAGHRFDDTGGHHQGGGAARGPRRTGMTATTGASKLLDALARLVGRTVVVAFLGFMVLPAVFIGVLSFSNDPYIMFPPQSWGTDRYVEVVTSSTWIRPITLSLEVAAATAVVTLAVVVPAMFALKRGRVPGTMAVESAGIAPMLFPVAAYAVGMYAVF